MESSNLSVVIRVRDLQICRVFYRDVLGLGAPVTDSNFWVEFSLGDGRSLCLDAAPGNAIPEEAAGRASWMICPDDPEGFYERMSANGYGSGSEKKDIFGYTVQEFKDPEGNPFYVLTEKSSPDESL